MMKSKQTRVLFFQGPPSSGKDSACDTLFAAYPEDIVKLSAKTQLFEDVFDYFNVEKDWFMDGYTEIQKNVPVPELKGLSRRQALIHVSEEVMKPKHGNDIYGKALAGRIVPGKINVISDAGFPEEIQAVVDSVGASHCLLIRISRRGKSFVASGDSRRYCHSDNPVMLESMGQRTDGHNALLDASEWFESWRCIRDLMSMSFYNNTTLSDFDNHLKTLKKMVDEGFLEKNFEKM